MSEVIKCACPSCSCAVVPEKAIERDGKVYCCETCAYECTEQTCVCIHEKCDEDH